MTRIQLLLQRLRTQRKTISKLIDEISKRGAQIAKLQYDNKEKDKEIEKLYRIFGYKVTTTYEYQSRTYRMELQLSDQALKTIRDPVLLIHDTARSLVLGIQNSR